MIAYITYITMVTYDLSHLTQAENQAVLGPIQDDEALFLFALIRGMRLRHVLELGGLDGYSARNFLKAVGPEGVVYTCDIHPVTSLAPNHRILTKNCLELSVKDLDATPLDLLFFDCHDEVQRKLFERFVSLGLVRDNTILALHDTGLHFSPWQCEWAEPVDGGFVHQRVERDMVGWLRETHGYDVLNIHTTPEKHSDAFPYRHGLTVCQKNIAFT